AGFAGAWLGGPGAGRLRRLRPGAGLREGVEVAGRGEVAEHDPGREHRGRLEVSVASHVVFLSTRDTIERTGDHRFFGSASRTQRKSTSGGTGKALGGPWAHAAGRTAARCVRLNMMSPPVARSREAGSPFMRRRPRSLRCR